MTRASSSAPRGARRPAMTVHAEYLVRDENDRGVATRSTGSEMA